MNKDIIKEFEKEYLKLVNDYRIDKERDVIWGLQQFLLKALANQREENFKAGITHQKQHIDEALRLYQQEYANTKMSERPNGWTVLEDIKKTNEKPRKTI